MATALWILVVVGTILVLYGCQTFLSMRVFSVLDTGKRTEIGVTVIVVGIIVAVISGLGLLSDLSTAQQALS